MSVEEVLKCVRLSRGALYNSIGRGEFPKPAKLGRRSYFSRPEVEAYLAERFDARYANGSPRAPKHAVS